MAKKILSCFIDEAGDFGDFESHSPYYIVSVIAHEQSNSIQSEIDGLEHYLASLGYPHHAIHTAPLIRRESDYQYLDMEHRRKLFNLLFRFARKCPIRFFTALVRKISPVDYKLFQVADLICTLDHIKAKIDIGQFSNSEREFFSSPHQFKKDYWRKLMSQRL